MKDKHEILKQTIENMTEDEINKLNSFLKEGKPSVESEWTPYIRENYTRTEHPEEPEQPIAGTTDTNEIDYSDFQPVPEQEERSCLNCGQYNKSCGGGGVQEKDGLYYCTQWEPQDKPVQEESEQSPMSAAEAIYFPDAKPEKLDMSQYRLKHRELKELLKETSRGGAFVVDFNETCLKIAEFMLDVLDHE